MKATMSERFREITRDPKKIRAVYEEISRLHASGERIGKKPVVTMGEHNYKVQLVLLEPSD